MIVRILSDVGAPETDGEKVTGRVRVDGVCACGTRAAGFACAGADADAQLAKVPNAARNRARELIILPREFVSSRTRKIRQDGRRGEEMKAF